MFRCDNADLELGVAGEKEGNADRGRCLCLYRKDGFPSCWTFQCISVVMINTENSYYYSKLEKNKLQIEGDAGHKCGNISFSRNSWRLNVQCLRQWRSSQWAPAGGDRTFEGPASQIPLKTTTYCNWTTTRFSFSPFYPSNVIWSGLTLSSDNKR